MTQQPNPPLGGDEAKAEPFCAGGPFDAPPFCPICGRAGTHYHSPDAIAQHRERTTT